jgi:nicotinate phosphoribosyltransferase
VVQAAEGGSILEFGLRRAQGPDAGIYGARASVIGGADATSNVLAGQMFDIPVRGTHAHSWVMSFPTEIEAFRAYAEAFPDACLLLVDTYDTLKSGVPNAIKVFQELRAAGHEPTGIRLDSGDLAYLTREARRMMDEAGFPDAKICASGDLDETLIRDLLLQGAKIDIWGVGTKLITSMDCPALGGVYKLSARMENGAFAPKIKISENPAKVTNPGVKKLLRLYDNKTGKAIADLIALERKFDAGPDHLRPGGYLEADDVTDYRVCANAVRFSRRQAGVRARPLGRSSLPLPGDGHLLDQYKRNLNPHLYKVDFRRAVDAQQTMLKNKAG